MKIIPLLLCPLCLLCNSLAGSSYIVPPLKEYIEEIPLIVSGKWENYSNLEFSVEKKIKGSCEDIIRIFPSDDFTPFEDFHGVIFLEGKATGKENYYGHQRFAVEDIRKGSYFVGFHKMGEIRSTSALISIISLMKEDLSKFQRIGHYTKILETTNSHILKHASNIIKNDTEEVITATLKHFTDHHHHDKFKHRVAFLTHLNPNHEIMFKIFEWYCKDGSGIIWRQHNASEFYPIYTIYKNQLERLGTESDPRYYDLFLNIYEGKGYSEQPAWTLYHMNPDKGFRVIMNGFSKASNRIGQYLKMIKHHDEDLYHEEIMQILSSDYDFDFLKEYPGAYSIPHEYRRRSVIACVARLKIAKTAPSLLKNVKLKNHFNMSPSSIWFAISDSIK